LGPLLEVFLRFLVSLNEDVVFKKTEVVHDFTARVYRFKSIELCEAK
jgi:hypothetical protein